MTTTYWRERAVHVGPMPAGARCSCAAGRRAPCAPYPRATMLQGFDAAVLAGAYHTLRDQRVRVLSFEYHDLWRRTGATLEQCTLYLEGLGYAVRARV